MGDDILTTLAYHGGLNPVIMLGCMLTPQRYIENLYTVFVFLHLYAAGAAFLEFCLYKKKTALLAVTGALIYVFSNFPLFYVVRYMYFLTPMIFFPLMAIGIEKIFNRESGMYFSVSVFGCIVCNFYFAYMCTICIFIYAVILYINTFGHEKKQFFHLFFRSLKAYLTGIMLSGVILVPVAIAFINGGRTAGGAVMPDNTLFGGLLHEPKTIAVYLLYLFAPNGTWGRASLLPIVALPVVFIWMNRKKAWGFKAAILLIVVAYCVPYIGSVFNGFSYYNDRWTFIVPFVFAYLFVEVFPIMLEIPEKLKKTGLITGLTGLGVLLIVQAAGWVKLNIYTMFSICAVLSAALIFSFSMKRKKQYYMLLGYGVLCSMFSIMFLYSSDYGNYIGSLFGKKGEIFALAESSSAAAAQQIEDTSFGRIETFGSVNNLPLYYGIHGTSEYWSVQNPSVALAQKHLGNAPGAKRLFAYSNFDQRTVLTTLANVKYFVAPEGKGNYAPFGFSQSGVVSKGDHRFEIYENTNALPLGFTYDRFITAGEYEKLIPAEKEDVLLDAIVLEENPDKLTHFLPLSKEKQLDYTLNLGEDVIWEDNRLTVKKNNAKIFLQFTALPDSETYIEMDGLLNTVNSNTTALTVTVSCQDKAKSFSSAGRASFEFFEREQSISNMGQLDPFKESTCEITFSSKGVYELNEITVIAHDLTSYEEKIARLSEETLENLIVNNGHISGDIEVDTHKMLFFSIPFSEGWRAYVDGQPATIYKANEAYLSVLLEPGKHSVELLYTTPGIKTGFMCTLIGFLCLVISWKFRRVTSDHGRKFTISFLREKGK